MRPVAARARDEAGKGDNGLGATVFAREIEARTSSLRSEMSHARSAGARAAKTLWVPLSLPELGAAGMGRLMIVIAK